MYIFQRVFLLQAYVIVMLSMGLLPVYANDETTQSTASASTETSVKPLQDSEIIISLNSALQLLKSSEQALIMNKKALKDASSDIEKSGLEKEQQILQEAVMKNKNNFIQLATGGSIEMLSAQQFEEEPINWKKELSDVMQPLVAEIKELTAGQREKEKLRLELSFYQNQLRSLKGSEKRVDALINVTANDTAVADGLDALKKELIHRRTETESQITVLDTKYRELKAKDLKDDSSWASQIRDMIGGILLHFLIAVIGACVAYYLVGLFIVYLNKVDAKDNKNILFSIRAIQFFLRMLAIVVALFVYSGVLIGFGEWALMTLSAILMFGVLLSLKDVLPQYLAEMRTILNLGSIREGERVIYNNIPWKVNHLDFYTEIYNRDLGASLRLPISEVTTLKSRPSIKSELWFPTRTDDFVLLSDGTYGQVIRQSPDSVLIDNLGSLKSYQVSDFLAAQPNNLSRQRFTLLSEIGVDYRYQRDVTTVMLEQMQVFVDQQLSCHEFAEHVVNLKVMFDKADENSLNYKLALQCKGSGAVHYNDMRRWLQKVAVDCCNEYGWEIPFPQVTMHLHNQ